MTRRHDRSPLPLLRRRRLHTFVDLGRQPLANSYLTADSSPPGPSGPIRCTRGSATNCFLVQVDDVVRADAIFDEDYAYFSSYLDQLGGARAPLRRGDDASGSRSARTGWWSRWPATTATCCSTSWPWACRCWASSPRPTPPRPPGARRADRGRLLRPGDRPRLAARRPAADLMAANNVLAHVPDIGDFVGRLPRGAEGRGRADLRVPAPAEPDRAGAVRHHLPRALLLPVAAGGGAGAAGRACGRSTSSYWRPTAARCAVLLPRGRRRTRPRPLVALRAEEAARGLGGDRLLRRLRAEGRGGADRFRAWLARPRPGPPRRRLWRGGQGQHLPELLRGRPRTTSSPCSTPAPPSRAASCRAAHSLILARGGARGAAGRPPDPALEPEGRDHGPDGLHRRRLGVAVPRLTPETRRLMRFPETKMPGVVVVRRRRQAMSAAPSRALPGGIRRRRPPLRPVQTSLSRNPRAGTLRGMHYQPAPCAEEPSWCAAVRGRIFDVAVDLRPDSPTYRQWAGAELSAGRAAPC